MCGWVSEWTDGWMSGRVCGVWGSGVAREAALLARKKVAAEKVAAQKAAVEKIVEGKRMRVLVTVHGRPSMVES